MRARARNGATAMPPALAALEAAGRLGRLGDDGASLARRRLPAPRRALVPARRRRRRDESRFATAGYITLRNLRRLLRQPAWVAITLIQPMIWLLLFGALFKRVVEIPGFKGGSYIEFLTPGVIVMTAISSAGWNGMAFIDDMRSGRHGPAARLPGLAERAQRRQPRLRRADDHVVQSLIIVGVGLAVGAHFPNGVAGVAILIVVACLLERLHSPRSRTRSRSSSARRRR